MKLAIAVVALVGCGGDQHPVGVQPWSGPPRANEPGDPPSPVNPTPNLTEQPRYEPPPTPLPIEYIPRAPAPPAPDPTEQQRWWCYRGADDWGQCELTRADCDVGRASWGKFNECDVRPPMLTRKDCEDVMARVRGMTECKRQDRVACFGKKHILRDELSSWCAPTIASCKAARAFVLKSMKDDIKVTSECKPAD